VGVAAGSNAAGRAARARKVAADLNRCMEEVILWIFRALLL